jgi:hypothetical protein
MRSALIAHPNSDTTRRIHDEAAASFDALFLAGRGDAMRRSMRSACSTIFATSRRSDGAATK